MTITPDQLIEAGLDAKSLDDVVNGHDDLIVITRRGEQLQSLARLLKNLGTHPVHEDFIALSPETVINSASDQPTVNGFNSIVASTQEYTISLSTTAPAGHGYYFVNEETSLYAVTIDEQELLPGESLTLSKRTSGQWGNVSSDKKSIIAELYPSMLELTSVWAYIPCTKGTQMTNYPTDQIWFDGDAFKAPRKGVFEVSVNAWVSHLEGATEGQVDLGITKVKAGASPGSDLFARHSVVTGHNTISANFTIRLAKGETISPALRVITPLTKAWVSSTGLFSSMSIKEVIL